MKSICARCWRGWAGVLLGLRCLFTGACAAEQLPDGRIIFDANGVRLIGDAKATQAATGATLLTFDPLRPSGGQWDFKPTRWGRYDVVLDATGLEPAQMDVGIAGTTLHAELPKGTAVTTVGRIYLAKSEPFSVAITNRAERHADLYLRSLTLRPAPEGDPVVQQADGEILLRSSQATTHSVMMRYEPATNKNCLGYWVNPSDWADWEFTLVQPGAFEVELWQGCGKDQGGSDVAVEIGGRRFDFVVEDTGHFQNFIPRKLGRVQLAAGVHTLAIRPQRKRAAAIMDVRQVRLLPVKEGAGAPAASRPFLEAKRIVVLGDSITYGGEWVEFLETWLRLRFPTAQFDIINLGLPSETVSGLSEAGHAGGAFPRPDLHERLGRALERTKPDLVLACYGMNDGIYFPFGQERAKAFQDGMRRLHEQVTATGAKLIHLTPPVFDPVPLAGRTLPAGLKEYPAPYEGYDKVLTRYSEWLLAQRARGWVVVDVHGPMRRFLDDHRRRDPQFRIAGDGIHPNSQGHWLIARELLRHLGAPNELVSADSPAALPGMRLQGEKVLKLVQRRQRVLKDSWLTYVGHRRPGMNQGKPLAEAEREATALAAQLYELTDAQFPGKRSRWFGYDRYDFAVDGKPVLVVAPKQAAPGRPWVWHGEFFGHKPEPDIALLGRGFHIVYMSVPDMLGSPEAVAHWNAFYHELTGRYGFAKRAALVGLSRGGLYVYNWAIANPSAVACLYGDAPVCDFKSWPGGRGKGPGSTNDWQLVLQRYGFKSDAEALAYAGNPVDNLPPLAAAKVPLLHIYGDADEAVPWEENTGVIAERYRKLGGDITLIAKPGGKHHPHGLTNSTPIVEFIWKHAANAEAREWWAAQRKAKAKGNSPP